MTPSRRLALPLAVLAWCALAIASLVIVMGPVSVATLGLSISRPSRLLVAAAVLGGAAAWLRGGLGPLLDDLARSRAPYVATLLLVVTGCAALLLARGAVSVGGADSAGYLAQAKRWRDGTLHVPLPLAIPGVPDAWPQSGLGLRPDATGTATVPTYPPGLPWLEAVALRVGGEAMAVRVIPAGATVIALVAIWLIAVPRAGHPGAAARRGDPGDPAALPVPGASADVGRAGPRGVAGRDSRSAARSSPAALAGAVAATALAILIRPNLAPLALAVIWQAAIAAPSVRAAWRRGLPIAIAAVVGVAVVASVQAYLYGSPLQSGYGRASELFAVPYIPENLRLYAAWLREGIAWPARVVLACGAAGLAVGAIRARGLAPRDAHGRADRRAVPGLPALRLLDVSPLRARGARARATSVWPTCSARCSAAAMPAGRSR